MAKHKQVLRHATIADVEPGDIWALGHGHNVPAASELNAPVGLALDHFTLSLAPGPRIAQSLAEESRGMLNILEVLTTPVTIATVELVQ